MPRLTRFTVLGVAAAVLAVSTIRAQEPDSAARTIADVGSWMASNLPKFGTFQVNVTGDWADVGAFRATSGTNRSVDARHEILRVSMEGCTLRFTAEFQTRGSRSERLATDVTLPLGILDLSLIRIQRYQLPLELRATNPRFEVYLRARSGSPGFVVTDRDRRTQNVWEYAIPIDRSQSGEAVMEQLQRAVPLCAG
jgi:hypothetical protein